MIHGNEGAKIMDRLNTDTLENPFVAPSSNEQETQNLEEALLGSPRKILLLLLNALPIIHVVMLILLLLVWKAPLVWRVGAGLLVLYLAPPLLARLLIRVGQPRAGRIAFGSKDFFFWWSLLNLQVLFCRFPFLDEILRMVPGLYSNWLRLWGSKIGRLTYWSAGTVILDRSYLSVGDDVIIGAGVRIAPHLMARTREGGLELILAPIKIGDRAVIGGYSVLTAGTEIANGACTRAIQISPPFSKWMGGRRVKSDKG